MTTRAKFKDLVEMVALFRSPRGCAWKRQLTLRSLPPYSRSEFEELMQAVEKEDWDNLREELGDVLFHIVLYAEIAKEQGKFDISDVVNDIHGKMVRRNPHVYGNLKLTDPIEIEKMWQEIKKKEKLEKARKSKNRGKQTIRKYK